MIDSAGSIVKTLEQRMTGANVYRYSRQEFMSESIDGNSVYTCVWHDIGGGSRGMELTKFDHNFAVSATKRVEG